MLSTQTAVVLDLLVTALTAALPASVRVVDGQPLEGDIVAYPELVVVGFSVNRSSVEVTQERVGLPRNRRQETLSIVCLVSVLTGSSGPGAAKSVRDRTVALLDLITVMLDDDRTLAGAVTRAMLSTEMALDQAQTPDGASATIECAITVTTL